MSLTLQESFAIIDENVDKMAMRKMDKFGEVNIQTQLPDNEAVAGSVNVAECKMFNLANGGNPGLGLTSTTTTLGSTSGIGLKLDANGITMGQDNFLTPVKLTGISAPEEPGDAANKEYVDLKVLPFSISDSGKAYYLAVDKNTYLYHTNSGEVINFCDNGELYIGDMMRFGPGISMDRSGLSIYAGKSEDYSTELSINFMNSKLTNVKEINPGTAGGLMIKNCTLDNLSSITPVDALMKQISVGGAIFTGLGEPNGDTDAATKKYVDDAIAAAIASLS